MSVVDLLYFYSTPTLEFVLTQDELLDKLFFYSISFTVWYEYCC